MELSKIFLPQDFSKIYSFYMVSNMEIPAPEFFEYIPINLRKYIVGEECGDYILAVTKKDILFVELMLNNEEGVSEICLHLEDRFIVDLESGGYYREVYALTDYGKQVLDECITEHYG